MDCPREPSAFGRYNTSIGPFADEHSESSQRRTKRREWELEGNFDDGYGFMGPSDVGRRGRDKERERMRKHAKEIDLTQDDDDDDWFNNRGRSNKKRDCERSERDTRDRDEKRHSGPPEKKTRIDISLKIQPSRFDFVAPSDRLLSRITSPTRDEYGENEEYGRKKIEERRGGEYRRKEEKKGKRDKERNRERGKGREDKEGRRKNEGRSSKQSTHPSTSYRERERSLKDTSRVNSDNCTRQQYYGGYKR